MKSLLLALGAQLVIGLPANNQARHLPHVGDEALPTLELANITKVGISDIQGRSLSGPFLGVNFPDPSIIYGDGSWKAYATSSNGKRVPIATSPDTFSWTLTGNDALPEPGSWVDANDKSIWAPDVQKNVSLRSLELVWCVENINLTLRMREFMSVSNYQRSSLVRVVLENRGVPIGGRISGSNLCILLKSPRILLKMTATNPKCYSVLYRS